MFKELFLEINKYILMNDDDSLIDNMTGTILAFIIKKLI